MLTEKTISLIKSTIPILEEHGEALTTYFYKRMFLKNPEVASFFNQTNQTSGTQQKALAGAICAYAKNIDNLKVLADAVELIAQKHVSLQIKPEHYPIVGANLLGSIQEVLNLPEDHEIITAWGEAYGLLAEILINREKQIYNHNENIEGGWKDFKEFVVIKKEAENDLVTSFYLKPKDNEKLPIFKAGQYITLRIPTPCGYSTMMRNYSLSNRPGTDSFRISVKRELGPTSNVSDGYVSTYLHTKINDGSSLEIGFPCGEFFLDTSLKNDRPLVLIAGGIGITPILSILKTVLFNTPEREIIFIHGVLNSKNHVFKETLDHFVQEYKNLKVYYRYSDSDVLESGKNECVSYGFIDDTYLKSIISNLDSEYYFCGPKPFLINTYRNLKSWNIPTQQIHFEFFGPRQELESPSQLKCPLNH